MSALRVVISANILGPRASTAFSNIWAAVCHSDTFCFRADNAAVNSPASPSVTGVRPSGNAIESSKRFPHGVSRPRS